MDTICKAGFEIIEQPPSSPDLGFNDYYLFHKPKEHLQETHVSNNEDVIIIIQIFKTYELFPSMLGTKICEPPPQVKNISLGELRCVVFY